MYEKSINQPEEFWGEIASEFKWDKKVCTSHWCILLHAYYHCISQVSTCDTEMTKWL